MPLFHSWLNPALEVRCNSRNDRGVYAKEFLLSGERLAIWGGHVMYLADEPVFSDGKCDFAVQIEERFVLGPKYESEIEGSDFFNHSCSPNAGFKGQIFLVAMRDIETDEEITFDYGMVMNLPEGHPYRIECNCGSLNCRGIVTGNDWKLPELQKRYDGWFQWYLQEKIDRLKSNAE